MEKDKKFYWIKLKDDFMSGDIIDFLMAQTNGAQYVVLYQMLCLKTKNTQGELGTRIGEVILEYDEDKIQRDCKYFSIDTIRVALELYKKLGLVYMQENGLLKITNFEELVGGETYWAKQKRNKRLEYKKLDNVQQESNKSPLYIDIDKDIDIDIDKDIDKKKDKDIIKDKKETYDTIIFESEKEEEVKDCLLDFIKMRQTIKRPLTNRALKMLINKLNNFSSNKNDKIKILEQSILNCWQDIYALKNDKGVNNGRNKQDNGQSYDGDLFKAKD